MTTTNSTENKILHCEKCNKLMSALCEYGIRAIETHDLPCLYKADDINKYLVRCVVEACKGEKIQYIKPTIISDGKWDHYNNKYSGEYNVSDVILDNDAEIVLVNGEAGIGKTFFVKQLYLDTSLYSLKNGCKIIPVLLSAEGFGNDKSTPEEWVNLYLKKTYKYINFDPIFFNPDYTVVFFIDSINGIQYSNYSDFKKKLNLWRNYIKESLNKYVKIKFVISSRYLDDLSCFEIRNYSRLFIQQFDFEQVELFIKSRITDETKINKLINFVKDNNELTFLKNPFFLNKFINSPFTELKNKTDVIDVFINSIFDKHISYKNEETSTVTKIENTDFLDVISRIAFDNQSMNRPDFGEDTVSKIISDNTQQFLDFAINHSILIKNSSKYKFTDLIVEEYFSGKFISNIIDEFGFDKALSVASNFKNKTCLIQSLKHVYNSLSQKEPLIQRLIELDEYVIAGECVLEDRSPQLTSRVSQLIAEKITTNNSIKKNIILGELLGNLGDERITLTKKNEYIEPNTIFVPDLKIYVSVFPVTNYEYSFFIADRGYQKKEFWENPDQIDWFDYENTIISICSFWNNIREKLNKDNDKFIDFCQKNKFDKDLIAHLSYFKAIPKDEFEAMIRDLYSEEKHLKPLMWDNPLYNNPSQPVVGVSIYEAFAYCNWLCNKTGKKYRLLTEKEWELVSGADQRMFSYGNKFNVNISNTIETGLNKVISVGLCQSNVSKLGFYDLTGNIFEWTDSVYSNPNPINDKCFKQYICKGGSWIQDQTRAVSKYSGRGMGWVRNLDLGFRMCYNDE